VARHSVDRGHRDRLVLCTGRYFLEVRMNHTEDTPMFELALRLLWDFFAIVGVISSIIALAFWLGKERYYYLLEEQHTSVTTPDCGSCKRGENTK
jgi:hypothetical protein